MSGEGLQVQIQGFSQGFWVEGLGYLGGGREGGGGAFGLSAWGLRFRLWPGAARRLINLCHASLN